MIYVLYHSKCHDGFAAAYCAWKKYGDSAKYIPVSYGKPIPKDAIEHASEIYILDFAYKGEELVDLSLYQGIKKVVVLDHHVTSQADLEPIIGKHDNLDIIFDMKKSGSYLAWEYFHPNTPVPDLIKHISDRDLWDFKLDKSDLIHKALLSYPMEFDLWDELILNVAHLKYEGVSCNRLYNSLIENICKEAFISVVGGYKVPVVNTSIAWSEVGVRLLELYPTYQFSASFVVFQERQLWNLRSRGDFDVSKVAKHYGGGGHKHAAGFCFYAEIPDKF